MTARTYRANETLLLFAADRAWHYHDVMNLGMPEMIFIFLLALVIFGPKKLPELGRQFGKALAEFKKASNEFRNQLETEMLNIELEERAKKLSNPEPKILPAEKLFDTISVPPLESIPREPMPSVAEPVPVDHAVPEATTANPSELRAVTPDAPSPNV
jgi:sec-independent protein translocase protein TatB